MKLYFNNLKIKRILLLIIALLISICILIYLHCNLTINENMTENHNYKNKEIVIARYNENLDWTLDTPFNEYSITIYNKGNGDEFSKPQNAKRIIPLNNVGRCDHTYLYHIVNNYDNLQEITVFLPGSCNMENKKQKAIKLLENIKQQNSAVFISDEKRENVKNELYDFILDEWESSDKNNKIINPEKTLEKSSTRPYGKWYESIFGDLVIKDVTYMGIFSVSKKDILQHPLEYYKNLMKQLETSSNPEVGHYIERSWAAVFHPMNNTKIM